MVKKVSRRPRYLEKKTRDCPNLERPKWALPFHIHTAASDKAIGGALGQIDEKLPYAIYFISKKLVNGRAKIYSHRKGAPNYRAFLEQIQTLYHRLSNLCAH